MRAQPGRRSRGGTRKGSGSNPAGGWPEGPVWFEFPAPLTPCTNPQPGSELPGPCLIWVLSPPRRHFAALKGRPGLWGGAVATAGFRVPPAAPPAPGLASPTLQLWRGPGPQSQTSQDCLLLTGVAAGVASWNRPPCPPRQPASLWFSFKTRAGSTSVSSYQVGQGEGGW